ncbi:MAG: ArsR/SmtB family transcription factor [Halioglobus sp.]
MSRKTSLPTKCERALQDHLNPELFKALCDPVRLTIVATLASRKESATVSDITECCGIDFSGVSRHLKMLKDSDVVQVEKIGREKLYSLNGDYLSGTLRSLADALDDCQQM